MFNHKKAFTDYIFSNNVSGSGKAASYVRALDLLSDMIQQKPLGFSDCVNIWDVNSSKRLQELHELVSEEARKGGSSNWNLPGIPKSYLHNGYCSAALNAYLKYLGSITSEGVEKDITNILLNEEIADTEKSTLINTRIGQGKFRQQLIDYWKACAVTGFKNTDLLVASHIKPWRDSNDRERLDPFNGLLLQPNLDKAFDLGYITFRDRGEIVISELLESPRSLGILPSMALKIKPEHQDYMTFHREMVYKN